MKTDLPEEADHQEPAPPPPNKKRIILLGVIGVTFAFFIGLASPNLMDWFTPSAKPPTAINISTPKEGEEIPTDEFSVRLFHYYLKKVSAGNMTVTPAAVTDCLRNLQRQTDAAHDSLFSPLNLNTESPDCSAEIQHTHMIFTNERDTLPQNREVEGILPIDFSENLAEAHSIMNLLAQSYTNGMITHMFSSASAPRGTRVLATTVLSATTDWYYPFHAHHTEQAEFTNADYTKSRVKFMKSEGNFRMVTDPEGKWKAVALFLRNAAEMALSGKDACALIIIIPTEEEYMSARPLATSLTAQDYGKIRTALARAQETPATIKLPRMEEVNERLDIFPALHAMGLGSLAAADAAPFPKLSERKPFPLDGFYQQCALNFVESPVLAAPPADQAGSTTTLEINRPFIWMLCPLATPEPPYAMGVREYL